MALKLYELGAAFQRLSSILEEREDAAEWGSALEGIQDEGAAKIAGIANIIKNMEAEQREYAEEAQRLFQHSKTLNKRVEWLRDYIQRTMETLDISQVKEGVRRVTLIPNSTPRTIVEQDSLPPAYYNVTLSMSLLEAWKRGLAPYIDGRTPDTARIKDRLLTGEEVQGARLERGAHVRIS